MNTNNSILLYGWEVWADSPKTNCRLKTWLAIQRIISAYRTVYVLYKIRPATTSNDTCESKENWSAVVAFIGDILGSKKIALNERV